MLTNTVHKFPLINDIYHRLFEKKGVRLSALIDNRNDGETLVVVMVTDVASITETSGQVMLSKHRYHSSLFGQCLAAPSVDAD